MSKPNTLLCTIGTSLFYPNLSNLDQNVHADLAQAYREKDWRKVAEQLRQITPANRLCGAEINSVTDLLREGAIEKVRLHLLYSDTVDGNAIAEILQAYFRADGWQVDIHRVAGLRDDDTKIFRTQGLRNLAKIFGERVRESGGPAFAQSTPRAAIKPRLPLPF